MKFYESEYSPLLIRIGDLNLDAFPDILTVLENKIDNSRSFKIILNIPKKGKILDYYKNSDFVFNYLSPSYIDLKDVEYISFFDLDENGELDLIINRRKENNISITGYFNIESYDNFFLKSLTTKSKERFFNFEIGTNYRYFVTDLDGSRKLRVAVQHPQCSGLNLDLPYVYMGIGLSYNYIENFHTITTSFLNITDYNLLIETPIIPNSQLLIYNYDEENQGNYYELDLLVTPITKIVLVIFVISAILLVLLIVIIILHLGEKVIKFICFNLFFLER